VAKRPPGLRALEKYAVRCGGGHNHRFGLDDAVLIKDNHIALAGDLKTAVERARRAVGHLVKIEVEVDSLDQIREALDLGVDVVLLDNMPLETLREAAALAKGRAITEASGGINPPDRRRHRRHRRRSPLRRLAHPQRSGAGCVAGCGVSSVQRRGPDSVVS
jgi:nicotinate-nucleotide pyrophosphorylase (carboxylating)